MKRREFITLLGGAVAWPLAVRAQQPTVPVVGLVSGRSLDTSARPGAAFTKGLSEAGYVDDKNVMVEYHWVAGQYDRLPSLMADLVRRRVAVIATTGDPPTLAAKATTATIPIVFGMSEDPVRHGVVASLAHPGGNATGINFLTSEVLTKRLGLLHELAPKAVRIAVLINPANTPRPRPRYEKCRRLLARSGCKFRFSRPTPAARSRPPSPPLYAIVLTLCLSSLMGSSTPAASNLRRLRCAIGFPRPIPRVSLSRSAA